jgi:predicted nucleotidyltransferase
MSNKKVKRDVQAILRERKNYLERKFGVIEIAIFGSLDLM